MRIKNLELSGFKSFMNPVRLDFGGGITAILGPNGCGKSNVVDAVRWVLGEQSAKQLRGDKMTNVVFGGTKRRKPLSMASVSVTFLNNDGRMPVPYEEVKITRRLSRDGTSDYLMNGMPCRLKDIRDLITDTGAGSHAYSIIEREMVDSVIQGHEDSRRFLLEEASGIMKYRLRRKEALRKLDMTSADLLRLQDIIEEIARQVRSLKRQMGRARRYQEIQERLRKCETYLAQKRLEQYKEERTRLESELESFRDLETGGDSETDAIRAKIEAMRTEMIEVERRHREAGSLCSELQSQLKEREDSILVLRERSESTRELKATATGEVETVEARLKQVHKDRAELESRLAQLQESLEQKNNDFKARRHESGDVEARYEAKRNELLQIKQQSFHFAEDSAASKGEIDVVKSRIEAHQESARNLQQKAREASERAANLAEELAVLNRRIETLEKEKTYKDDKLKLLMRRDEELVAALESQREERAEIRTRLDSLRSQHQLLQSLIAAFDGYGRGAKNIMERHADHDALQGSLADLVQAPPGLEAAFDALMSDVLDALCVKDVDSALSFLDELRQHGLGNATFVFPSGWQTQEPGLDLQRSCQMPGIVGLATDLLPDSERLRGTLRKLLANAVVAEDAESAQAFLARVEDPWVRVATRDGVLFTGRGTVFGGSQSAEREVSLLGRQARLAELASEVADFETQLEGIESQVGSTEAALHACRGERNHMETSLREDEEAHLNLSVTKASLETAFDECNQTCGIAQKDLAAVEEQLETWATRLPELTRRAETLSEEGDAQKAVVARLEREYEELEKEREAKRQESSEMRVAFVELQGEVESCTRQLERLSELQRELGELNERRGQEIERARRDLERYAHELEEGQRAAAAKAKELESARDVMNEVGLQLDAQRTDVETQQGRLADIEKKRREQESKVHATQLALSEARMRSQNLLDRMQEQYEIDEPTLLTIVFEWDDDEGVPDDAMIKELKGSLSRMGPVNLLALDEFEEKSKRLEFLEAQREDLETASASLRETIEKINRTARFLFMETFEQVRTYFRDTIRTVFDGGDGDLLLSNPEDPLDSDVEIRVRPRGKKIDTLTQLSSGERALTAIALLFSIYLVKPSPFCVFDEVDAPLDDANILRFVNLLYEFRDRTQFIVITHNKLTMEAADRLYGVTMEEEGVSKLVTVSLDGENRGVPRRLKKRVDRAAATSAMLQPSSTIAESVEAEELLALGERSNGGKNRRRKRQASASSSREDRNRAAARVESPDQWQGDSGTEQPTPLQSDDDKGSVDPSSPAKEPDSETETPVV